MRYNIWAILVCVVAGQFVAMGWYMSFATPWLELSGLAGEAGKQLGVGTAEYLKNGYSASLASALLQAFGLAWLFQRANVKSAGDGVLIGLVIGVAFFVPTTITMNLFEARPFNLSLIDGGSSVVSLVVFGAILGGWRKR
jgi:hypothetical protein